MKKNKITSLFTSLFLFAVAAIWISPLIFAFFTSFKTNVEVKKFAKYLNIIPQKWTTDNYLFVLKNAATPFVKSVINSFIVSLVIVILIIFIASMSAYAYERLEFKGKEVLFWTLFGISLFPTSITLVPQYYLYDALGWTNKLICLITPYLGNVFYIFLLRNFMHGIPMEFSEAARIDGANDFKIYRSIILPCVYPTLMVVALFAFTGAWNDLMWPSLAMVSSDKLTLTASIRLLSNSYGDYYERTLAACMLAMIPTFVIYIFTRKYFTQGIQLSAAVKG